MTVDRQIVRPVAVAQQLCLAASERKVFLQKRRKGRKIARRPRHRPSMIGLTAEAGFFRHQFSRQLDRAVIVATRCLHDQSGLADRPDHLAFSQSRAKARRGRLSVG